MVSESAREDRVDEAARAYIAKRGLAEQTVEKFGLGYSDRSGRALLRLFEQHQFPAAHMERQGRFKEMALASLVTSIITATATIGFVVSGYSYMSIAFTHVIGAAVYSLIFILRAGLACWLGLLPPY